MSVDAVATSRSGSILWIGRTTLIAWLAYLLIAPTIGFGWIESWHNEQRAVQVVLLACTAVAYCVMGLLMRSEDSVSRWHFPVWLLAFLALGLVSALRAQYVFAALAEVSMFALLAILIMFTARVVSADVERSFTYARWFALLFSTAYVLGVATRYLAAVNLGRAIDLDVLILGYANPRFPSALHAVLIPFLALTVIEKKELWSLRVGAAVVLAFLWAINLGLGTRGIWFAYAIAVPVTVLLIGWRPVARLLAVLTLTALAGVCLYFILFPIAGALTGAGAAVQAPTDNLTTVTSREVLWVLSWQAIKSSPLLGIGPMQFAALASRVGAHPHNWPMQIAAEWGLPALGLLAFAIFQLGKAVRRTTTSINSLASITLAASVALLLGLVDGNLVMPVSQIGAALAVGMLMGALRWGEQPRERRWAAGAFLILTAFAGAIASGTVIAFGASTLPDQSRSIESFRRAQPGAWLVPRFWEQGNLM